MVTFRFSFIVQVDGFDYGLIRVLIWLCLEISLVLGLDRVMLGLGLGYARARVMSVVSIRGREN